MDAVEPKKIPLAHAGVWKSTKAAITIVVLGLLIFFALKASNKSAPLHAGRSANEWLLDYANSKFLNSTNATTTQQASVEAFRQMGTDGVSFLIESLDRKDTAWNRMAMRLHPKLPGVLRRRISEPVAAEGVRGIAFLVLLHVSENQPAEVFSELLKHLDSPNPGVRSQVWRLVPFFPSHFPTVGYEPYEQQFRDGLSDTNYWIRLHAVDAMLYLNKATSEMIPALSPALTSGDVTSSNSAQAMIRRLEKLPPKKH